MRIYVYARARAHIETNYIRIHVGYRYIYIHRSIDSMASVSWRMSNLRTKRIITHLFFNFALLCTCAIANNDKRASTFRGHEASDCREGLFFSESAALCKL